jgi:aldehyde dehydrogenase (NAD+)
MGPVVSEEQLQRVMGYIELGRDEGAQLLAGGERIGEEGYFVQPTIFDGVRNDMRIAQEEIFGPVASVISVADVEEAAQIANQTMYGLAATVWTRDIAVAHRLAKRLAAGTVWINTNSMIDPSTSFGGFKQSGYGRELGVHSIETYTEVKTVWVGLR